MSGSGWHSSAVGQMPRALTDAQAKAKETGGHMVALLIAGPKPVGYEVRCFSCGWSPGIFATEDVSDAAVMAVEHMEANAT